MGERRPNDNYTTNIGLARWAVGHAKRIAMLGDTPRMLEPCCGDDAPFATAAKEQGLIPYGFDVRDVKPGLWVDAESKADGSVKGMTDYSTFQGVNGGYDLIATNPPFIIGEKVVRSSLDMLAPHGAAVFLVKMAFLGTQDRSKLFKSRPPAEVWILTARPSFTGDGGTDIAQEYAFVFWHGKQIDSLVDALGMRSTKLYWLDNKRLIGAPDKRRVRIEKGQANE